MSMKCTRAVRAGIVVLGLMALLTATPAFAATFVFNVVSNGLGLDDGHACLSTEAGGACASNAKFDVPGTYAVTGSLTVDDVANTTVIDITLTTGTMTGSYDGVDEIVFSNVRYVATYPSFLSGGSLFGTGTPTGTVSGAGATYEQLLASNNVAGPDPINESSIFSGLSCAGLTGVGLCGFTVGGSRDFQLPVGATSGGDSMDFVHTFNFNVVEAPEPGTALLIPLGLGVIATCRRRR